MIYVGAGILIVVIALLIITRGTRRPLDPDTLPQDLPNECYDLIRQNRVVDAVKIVREREGLGLKDAYDRIRGRYTPPAVQAATSSEIPDECKELMRANRKIEAIKVLREATGLGLADAKNRVEAWQAKDAARNVETAAVDWNS